MISKRGVDTKQDQHQPAQIKTKGSPVSNRHLCAAPTCSARGYHSDGCDDDTCTGCLPRLAADGLNLCPGHRDGIERDARQAAELHSELALVLAGATSGQGEKMSGSRSYGTNLADRAVDARTTIRAVLVAWCLLISGERGHTLPEDNLPAMGACVAKNADWLAAHPAAGECADELHDLVRMAHPIAYPTGARVFEVGPCVAVDCGGTIKAICRRADSLLPSSLVCDADPNHEWPADQWLSLGRQLRRAA